MKREQLRLYLVTDSALSLGRPLEEVVGEAVAGGVTMVQLREKEASTREFVELALRLGVAALVAYTGYRSGIFAAEVAAWTGSAVFLVISYFINIRKIIKKNPLSV